MRYFLVFLSLSLANIGVAEEAPVSAADRDAFGCVPLDLSIESPDFTFEVSAHFSELQRAAVQLNTQFCNALNDPIDNKLPIEELAVFGLFAETEANLRFRGTGEQDGVSAVMRQFASALNRGQKFPTTMPDFETIPSADMDGSEPDPVAYSVTVSGATEHIITSDSNLSCVATAGVVCAELILDLDNAIQPYKRSYQVFVTDENSEILVGLQSDWNAFFERGRSMTTLDLAITSWFERDHMRQGFIVGPVERQWFALHPNVILQYSDDVPKGEQFKPGLSIEWFGVNYWQDSAIGIPFGASLTSTYTDRAGLNSVGHGITLHFDNRFTIGWTKHGSENAFHVSADLLALLTEKKSAFKEYKEKVLSLD